MFLIRSRNWLERKLAQRTTFAQSKPNIYMHKTGVVLVCAECAECVGYADCAGRAGLAGLAGSIGSAGVTGLTRLTGLADLESQYV